MSNNTKRLSFFAKIAQRSTALQSLLEEATGKSAVGAIAPDGAGRQDYPTPPDPYTTQRYEKDIALANTTPVPTEAINPNLEARIKHVKEFYRGESPWFMDSVGIKRYPNHYHVAWTVPSAADGTLSATANGYPLFNGEAVIEGATIVLTATPASGKQVNQWSGLPQGATTAGNTATFTLAAEVNASVTFAAAATVTSFMEYYYDGGGTQSIFVRDSDADIPEPTGEGAPTSYMYAWYAESQDDYRYTDTASPVADMHCVRYDGTNLWWYSSAREEWQNYSDVLYPEVPNTRSIIASIDPHMYQNIKVHLQVGEASSEVVLNRYFAGDTYDSTEGDGNVAIAWQGTLGGSPLIFYTKSVDIVASTESGKFDSTHIWNRGVASWTDLTDNGNAEILAVDVVTALRFESEEENATITLSNNGSGAPTGVQYKTDGGEWTDYTMGTTGAITMPCEFKAESWDLTPATGEVKFSASEGASVVVSGHITSLCGRYGTTNNTLTEYTSFPYLFYQLPVTDASNLILASNTTYGCYENMFYACTSLTYRSDLPVLSATSLSPECYYGMFHDCTSLTEAPALPATTLASNCYAYMFQGCTSLLETPVLSAETLVEQCYTLMFYGCSSLNEVHCAATDISATECTDYWLYGVSASGDFYGKSSAGWTEGSASGIPSGWTFHEE